MLVVADIMCWTFSTCRIVCACNTCGQTLQNSRVQSFRPLESVVNLCHSLCVFLSVMFMLVFSNAYNYAVCSNEDAQQGLHVVDKEMRWTSNLWSKSVMQTDYSGYAQDLSVAFMSMISSSFAFFPPSMLVYIFIYFLLFSFFLRSSRGSVCDRF